MAKLKTLAQQEKVVMNIKLTPEERKIIQDKADKFAGENASAWIRYAATNYEPKKTELK